MGKWRNPKTVSIPYAGEKRLSYVVVGFESQDLQTMVAEINQVIDDFEADTSKAGAYIVSVDYQMQTIRGGMGVETLYSALFTAGVFDATVT